MPEVLSQEWEQQIKERYAKEATSYFEKESSHKTIFGRHNLDSLIWDFLGQLPTPNVLCVGVGMRGNFSLFNPISPDYLCGTYPFELAAELEALGKDYKMTIAEINELNLSPLKRTERFSVKPELDMTHGKQRAPIKRYMDNTKQKKLMHRHLLEVPKTFKAKKDSGDIHFVLGDIVTLDLAPHGPFDFAHCLNVFMHLPFQYRGPNSNYGFGGDILDLALYNIIRNLKQGGMFLVDERINDNTGLCVATEYSMKEIFQKRGLARVEKVIPIDSKYSQIIGRRL